MPPQFPRYAQSHNPNLPPAGYAYQPVPPAPGPGFYGHPGQMPAPQAGYPFDPVTGQIFPMTMPPGFQQTQVGTFPADDEHFVW